VIAFFFGAMLALVPDTALPHETTGCDSTKAQMLKGKPFSAEVAEEARRITRAGSVRAVGPGFISTSDRRPNRLNVEVDRAGIITNFWCE
jgi:hypothetical protein